MMLAPYAGFDPDEPALDDDSAWPEVDTTIDLARARDLRAQGHSWPAIGQMIAAEQGRAKAFDPSWVCRAVLRGTRHATRGAR